MNWLFHIKTANVNAGYRTLTLYTDVSKTTLKKAPINKGALKKPPKNKVTLKVSTPILEVQITMQRCPFALVLCFAFISLLISVRASAQTIYVTAGVSGAPDATTQKLLRVDGRGGTPTVVATGFDNAIGLTLDASNNIYVADAYHGRIAKFASDGSSLGDFASGLPIITNLATSLQ